MIAPNIEIVSEYSPSGMTWNLPLKKQMGWKFHGGKISCETDEIREPCPMSCQACSLTLSPFNSTHVPFLYNIKDARLFVGSWPHFFKRNMCYMVNICETVLAVLIFFGFWLTKNLGHIFLILRCKYFLAESQTIKNIFVYARLSVRCSQLSDFEMNK